MLLRESVVQLEPGSVLAGRFQIRRVLGKGATGVVLEADDRVSRSLVALKVFKPEIASDDRWQEIVGSELRHARQIMHPNVCRVFDAGEADGYRFLSMEFASGGSLRQRLKDGTNRSFEERVSDARAVVNGLAAIHAAGMIHRDVKPDNVLLMEDGRLVLTDFGLAVAPGQTTFVSGYSGAVGTPSYMAPEVALGGDASMASDVFSLGVILHEIFFDRRPVWETTKRGRFLKSPVDRQSARRLRQMANLCAQCLEELAPRRPASALEVRRSFERAVVGRYGTVVGALRAGKWGLGVGLMLALVASASVFVLSRPADKAKRMKLGDVSLPLLERGTLLASTTGRLRCMSPSSDGKVVRVIWGTPARPEQIEVETGRVSPWNLQPETYTTGCPVLAPDGRRLAFTVGNESRQILVSVAGDGSGATPVATGSEPQWMPGGQELLYRVDERRVALITPGGLPFLVPEANAANETFMTAAVNATATQLAIAYDGPQHEDSLVAIYALPSLEVLRRYRTPRWVNSATYAGGKAQLYFTARTTEGFRLFSEEPGHEFRGRAHLGEWNIFRAVGDPSGMWLGLEQTSASLIVTTKGEARAVAHGRDFDQVAQSPKGYAAARELLEDGRMVIGVYDPSKRRYGRVSNGRIDMEPLFAPSGDRLAYIDWTNRRIALCELLDSARCKVLVSGEDAWWLAGFSPKGDRLTFFAGTPSGSRLRVVKTADGSSRDLGYSSNRRCRVRWQSEERFWIFREGANPHWSEIDLSAGKSTGRTEPAVEAKPGACPANLDSSYSETVRIARREAASVWRYANDD
jgi:serine/threonine protein kinase